LTTPSKLFALDQDALVEMCTIDATPVGGTVYRFTNNDLYGGNIVWAGDTYTAFPMMATGFEKKSSGTLARPTLTVSNIGGIISAICKTYDDLIGLTYTRIRTHKKYLDAVNFGGVNPTANPAIEYPREIWQINRRITENRMAVVFELASPWDVQGISLPKRVIMQNSCGWKYRSAECGYSGGAVATELDVPTGIIGLDKCSKKVSGCKLRFGNDELPFGGFPSVGLFSGQSR